MPPSDRPSAHTLAAPKGRERTAVRAGRVRIALGLLGAISAHALETLAPYRAGFVAYLALALLFQWTINRRLLRSVGRAVVMGAVDVCFLTFLVQRLGTVTSPLPLVYVVAPVLYATTTSRRRVSMIVASVSVALYMVVVLLELLGVLTYAPATADHSLPGAATMLLTVALVAISVFVTSALTAQLIAALGRANARLREVSQHDELTGLYNRRYVMQRLDDELARLRRRPGSLMLAMIDLDGFKRVNDEEGHDVGDTVLRAVADALAQATRRADVVARWGGDEFVILLPNTEPRGAAVLGNRILDQTRAAAQSVCPGIPVSASIGTTVVTADDEPTALMRRVDEQLYDAKRAGGDRIVSG